MKSPPPPATSMHCSNAWLQQDKVGGEREEECKARAEPVQHTAAFAPFMLLCWSPIITRQDWLALQSSSMGDNRERLWLVLWPRWLSFLTTARLSLWGRRNICRVRGWLGGRSQSPARGRHWGPSEWGGDAHRIRCSHGTNRKCRAKGRMSLEGLGPGI